MKYGKFFKKTNNDFVPRLTERVDNVHDISAEEQEKPEKNTEPEKVFEDIKDNEKIEGCFSFRQDYPLEIFQKTIIFVIILLQLLWI